MTSHSIEGLSDGGLREKIARVIDPEAWSLADYMRQKSTAASPMGLELSATATTRPSLVKADAILALSAAPERVDGGGWEPIESAPKDGTRVLLGRFTGQRKANYEGYVATDFWHFRGKHGYDGFGNFNSHYWPATHWQPLPSPPIGAEGGRPTSSDGSAA